MRLISKLVYQGLTRKNSNQKEADRLELLLHEYMFIKKETLEIIKNMSDVEVMDDHFFYNIDKKLSIQKDDTSKVTEVHQNLDAGTSKITGISSTEPKTPNEIIALLGIDTAKWKLSQFWNKEQNNKWLVSALITRLPTEQVAQKSFLQELVTYKLPSFPKVNLAHLNSVSTEKVCGVISLQVSVFYYFSCQN